jgi:hypothetical protein
MDRLNESVELSNDDIALAVGRLTLDNLSLSKEVVRLRQAAIDKDRSERADEVRTE